LNKKRKMGLAISCLVAAATVVSYSAWAFFSDYTADAAHGNTGNVRMSMENVFMTNAEDISPGDNDLTAAKTYIPAVDDPTYNKENPGPETISTTPHEIRFTIHNDGNKTIRTRHTLMLTVTDSKGNIQDPTVFSILNEQKTKELGSEDYKKLGTKTFVMKDNSEKLQIGTSERKNVKAIKYVLTSDIFDGSGANAETSDKATVHRNASGESEKEYLYNLSMQKAASDTYQNDTVSIDIVADAIQLDNTTNNDWTMLAKKTIQGKTTGITTTVAPEAES